MFKLFNQRNKDYKKVINFINNNKKLNLPNMQTVSTGKKREKKISAH